MNFQYYLCKIGIHRYRENDRECLPIMGKTIITYKCIACGEEIIRTRSTWA